MKGKLTVTVNGEAKVEYDRGRPLPAHQRAYLDKMDREMDRGIPAAANTRSGAGTGIESGVDPQGSPDQLQRARFVATSLIRALIDGNDPVIAAACAYLAVRIPELQQVRARVQGNEIAVDLVFDRAYAKETPISFVPRDKP